MSYEERFYREKHNSQDLIKYRVAIEESDLMISSDFDAKEEIEKALSDIRLEIKKACAGIEGFEDSLEPLNMTSENPVINHMIDVSKKAEVGPMAAVAGTVSEYVVKNTSPQQMIVENGGDIYISSESDRNVLVYAGNSPFSNRIGVTIPKELMPVGVCTSAGTVGHSLSFGKADAALIISKDTALADAVATSIGNRVKSVDDIQNALDFGKNIEGVLGILIVIGESLGVWGEIKLFSPDK